MSDSLKDQLLGLGFKPAPKPERNPARKPSPPQRERKPAAGKGGQASAKGRAERKPRPRPEMDLGKAFALRAQQEKQERIDAERQKQEQARLRREAKARLAQLLDGKALNDPAADIARHFDYGGKIKRIHVTAAQLKALNGGELGVVQLDGRYLLVPATLLAEAESIFAPAIALKVDPDAPAAGDPYADPQYQVPDDLVW
jgi:uncharacterized protein YaiL (DUF2058 family)